MKAEEARKLALSNAQPEIEKVISLIKEAVAIGKLSIQIDRVKPGTFQWLKENGYKYDTIQDSDKAKLSW
jgi:hypothetical protein